MTFAVRSQITGNMWLEYHREVLNAYCTRGIGGSKDKLPMAMPEAYYKELV